MNDLATYFITHRGSKDTSGIYAIRCVYSGRIYIGSSRNLSKRISFHFRQLNNNLHGNAFMQRDFIKNKGAFEYGILENCLPEKLIEREIYWIDFFDTKNRDKGYNSRITPESNAGFVMPQVARDKISATMKGRKQSSEHSAKQCIARRGRKFPEAGKILMSLLKLTTPVETIKAAYNYTLLNSDFRYKDLKNLFGLTRKQCWKVKAKEYPFL